VAPYEDRGISGPIVARLREALVADTDAFAAGILAYEATRALFMRMLAQGGDTGWPEDPWPAVWAAAAHLADQGDNLVGDRRHVSAALRRLVGWRPVSTAA
jgi:hypothetical protein